MDKKEKKLKKRTSIGGQALFEGILMKGPHATSVVVRKKDGTLESKYMELSSLSSKYKIFDLPFFRGIGALADSLKMGTKAIDYSTSFFEEEEEEKKKTKFGELLEKAFITVSGALMLGAFVFAFFFLPTMLANLFRNYIDSNFILNLIEGLVRVTFFLAYIVVIGQINDIKRVFMYHGAEHKTIATYEFGEELTVENVRKNSRLHPRCGTSFMFNMVIISSLVLALFGWPDPLLRFVTRILILPCLVGITYELNRWTGRSDSALAKALAVPGMFIQKIGTVKEPTDDMIEVAIEALKMVIPENEEDDIW